MKIRNLISIVTVIIAVALTSCSKNDKDNTAATYKIKTIDATSHAIWVYIKFTADSAIISDSTSWDIALQRYYARTNGGKSGVGQCGVYNSHLTKQAGYDALQAVPDTATFVTDDTVKVAGMGGGFTSIVVNPVLYNDAFDFVIGGQGTTLVPKDYIFVLRTADGKYAKIWIQGYYNSGGTSGYVKFQYKYQPDGSKSL